MSHRLAPATLLAAALFAPILAIAHGNREEDIDAVALQ